MSDEDKKESAVEVTLPDESNITEVELNDRNSKIAEPQSNVRAISEDSVEKVPNKVDEREKALQEMKRQYEKQKQIAEAERNARQKAEYYAHQQAQQVGRANNEVQDSNLRIIMNAIDSTEQAAAVAERDYAEAMAAGDYSLAAKAQRAIAQAESHLLQLNNGKSKLEEMLQQTSEGSVYEPQVPSFEPRIPQDPVEMYAERLTPKSAKWLREHPEAAESIEKLTAAHTAAIQLKGYEPESKDYFRYIEKQLGMSRENYDEPRDNSKKQKTNLSSAPVSSSGSVSSSYSSGSANTMVLSPQEVEMAILAEPELPRDRAIEAYARNKAYLVKQGKLSA